jgi:hypothetical protein
VTLGDSSIATNRLATLIAYATDVTIDGLTTLLLRTINGAMTIRTGVGSTSNHLNLISQAAQIIASAAQGISFTTSSGIIHLIGGTASHVISTAGQWIGVGVDMTMTSNHINLENAAATVSWLETNPNTTYQCPMAGTALTSLAGTSILIGNDLALASGTRFHSLNPSGRFESTGFSFYCNAQIDTVDASPLILQNNASTLVDIRGYIINTVLNTPVTVSDTQGLSVDDGGSPSISNLFTNHMSPVGAGTDIVIHGNLIIEGDLSVTGSGGGGGAAVTVPTGTITAVGGTCCGAPSDVRLKTNVTNVAAQTDLDRILAMPRRISFRYKKSYLGKRKATTEQGFIAQELEEAGFSHIVEKQKKMRLENGQFLADARTVDYRKLVPELVGAIQALNSKVEALNAKIDALNANAEALEMKCGK